MGKIIIIFLLAIICSCSVSRKTEKKSLNNKSTLTVRKSQKKEPIIIDEEKNTKSSIIILDNPYQSAYLKLEKMLQNKNYNFKKAVFIVENTYLDNKINEEQFENNIRFLTELTVQLMNSRELIYNGEDKEEVKKYASLFSVLNDTITIQLDSNKIGKITPYSYDFNDIWGNQQWSNMFVSKLLETKKGNCHSLPYLYKIIANEIGADAHIAVAPNHFYIKHKNKVSGWYNTELTSGIFPVDAWLMASGYIHLDAIVNKLYMEALTEEQSIALCLIDLAKGHQNKFGNNQDNEFILKCCKTALAYYPNYINALLLQAETKKTIFDNIMKENLTENPSDVLNIPYAKTLFIELTSLYAKIHKLGYRKMPQEMYLNWLLSLKEERTKYENKKITNFNSK